MTLPPALARDRHRPGEPRVRFRSEWRWRYWIVGVTLGNCHLHHHVALCIGPWCGSMDVRKP